MPRGRPRDTAVFGTEAEGDGGASAERAVATEGEASASRKAASNGPAEAAVEQGSTEAV